jgi:hypothetical protein
MGGWYRPGTLYKKVVDRKLLGPEVEKFAAVRAESRHLQGKADITLREGVHVSDFSFAARLLLAIDAPSARRRKNQPEFLSPRPRQRSVAEICT